MFTDQSMIRRVNQEALVLLGGGRAVLLQLAHPLVAAGVADYSSFRSAPLERLFGTLEMMHLLVFGNQQEIKSALEKFHSMHGRIRGRLSQGAGLYPGDTSYTGEDPDLKLWVYATLVDTSLISYERFVAPLSTLERNRFYENTLVLARLLGIPDEDLPSDLESFHSYMQSILASDALAVTDMAHELAWDVLDPNVEGLQYASAILLRFVTAGLLPDRLRQGFELAWGPRRQILLDWLSWTTRLVRPVAPEWLWKSPQLDGANFLRWLLWPTY